MAMRSGLHWTYRHDKLKVLLVTEALLADDTEVQPATVPRSIHGWQRFDREGRHPLTSIDVLNYLGVNVYVAATS